MTAPDAQVHAAPDAPLGADWFARNSRPKIAAYLHHATYPFAIDQFHGHVHVWQDAYHGYRYSGHAVDTAWDGDARWPECIGAELYVTEEQAADEGAAHLSRVIVEGDWCYMPTELDEAPET